MRLYYTKKNLIIIPKNALRNPQFVENLPKILILAPKNNAGYYTSLKRKLKTLMCSFGNKLIWIFAKPNVD